MIVQEEEFPVNQIPHQAEKVSRSFLIEDDVGQAKFDRTVVVKQEVHVLFLGKNEL